MKIILSKQCESLTGSLGRGFGYHIQKRKNGFFVKRNSNGDIPPNGHLRFILSCANLAQSKLHITDVSVSRDEMMDALWEAGQTYPATCIAANKKEFPSVFRTEDVINLKKNYNL